MSISEYVSEHGCAYDGKDVDIEIALLTRFLDEAIATAKSFKSGDDPEEYAMRSTNALRFACLYLTHVDSTVGGRISVLKDMLVLEEQCRDSESPSVPMEKIEPGN